MKIVKFFAVILGLVALSVFMRDSHSNEPLRPSQIPAKENIGNAKLPPMKPQEKIFLRKAYAKEFDQTMLDNRIESTTIATGPSATTLQTKCALASRVMANELDKKLDWDRLRELGFRRVHLINGFEGDLAFGYHWNVE